MTAARATQFSVRAVTEDDFNIQAGVEEILELGTPDGTRLEFPLGPAELDQILGPMLRRQGADRVIAKIERVNDNLARKARAQIARQGGASERGA